MFRHRLISSAVVFCVVLAGLSAGATLAQSAAGRQGAPVARKELIVTPAWLAAHLADANLVLLHVGGSAVYNAGHIPGAQNARTWRIKPSDTDGFNEMGANDLTLELLPDTDLPAVLSRHGITKESRIVVYFGTTEYTSATRLMLALEHAGLGDRTSLLQGGMPAWQAEGHPITTDVPVVKPSTPGPLHPRQVTVDAAFVQAKIGARGFALVDVREPAVYDGVPGANKSAPREPLGHLPSALNIPNEAVVDQSRKFLPAAELKAIFANAGVKPGDTIITYCYTGQRATAVMLAAETLGYKTLLYDGSAEDWAARKLPFVVKSPQSARDQLLVSPAWLSQHLKDDDLVVIHVGMGDTATYQAGHIPRAQYIPMEAFVARNGRVLMELPAPATLQQILQRHGISERSKIVLYFGKDEVSEATRVLLTLDHAGLGASTSLLQGGLRAWIRAGQPTTTDVPAVRPSAIGPLKTKIVTVDAAFIQANAGKPGISLIDARDQSVYDGISGRDGRAGHIPGATGIPYRDLYDEARELRPAAELETIFAKAGVKKGDTIVSYCWLGQYATATLFAARTLGYNVLLYDGSFDDWTARNLPLDVVKKR